ncbi:C2 domain-containing protein 2-like isoform X2 [Sinocyclocheilus anshuiensis]|uniref:C2 domain-containing protein 2-like isoform X2 n=1 Tax=Sinocyclocheilus anshuiensis TaxID=1608454 RepID=UPI0007B78F28|nr:PREDICTED: C2 domain-containing protein 2-like isoform X2 [Sinocyclocheilus anshuiensis]
MSSVEAVFSWVGDWQWLCMVTLFLASVVTLIIYLVLYFSNEAPFGKTPLSNVDSEEADGILCWVLSLKSWKSQWRRAWFRSLNEEACRSQSGIQLTFEEDGVQSSELAVDQISSFTKTPGQKNVLCQVVGNKLQFSLSALPSSMSSETPLRYSVKISPLRLQLALQMKEVNEEVEISWGVLHLDSNLHLTPSFTQGDYENLSEAAVNNRLRQVLSRAQASVTLSSRPAESAEVKEVRNKTSQVTSPPKPPRAHEWKLLVKNIRVTCKQEDGAAGGMNPQCILQLDDPPQKVTSSVLTDTSTPAWDQPFIFELSGRSKELNIQVVDNGRPLENGLLGQVSVPFDLVKKHPKGQQTFSLMTKDQVTGSLTTEFTYLEPSEVRSWQMPTPAPTKKVEMDRTVMPCGTVVTTVTAVRSKPGRPLAPESKSPSKNKLAERRVSEQTSLLGAKVSKALSSSDTELLMLNGTDPVAEAAIRQLHESAKQKLKSPVKKSTIIISGVAKAPLTQDEEMALMAGYAAAMDASMSGASEGTSSEALPSETVVEPSVLEPTESLVGANGTDHVEDWESQAGEDPDADKTSLCISETGSKKGKGSFLHKGAKLFFRRRHQRKEPGMSQSHNDLQYLEHPEAAMMGDREKRTATFRRIINRKLLPRSKSKTNGTTSQLGSAP